MVSYYYDETFFIAVLLFTLLLSLVIYVVIAFFMMRLFAKAGVQGQWRAWVPVYNALVFAKLGDISPWPVLILFAVSVIPFLGFLTALALAVLMALAAWRVGTKLQKDGVWVVLFILVAPVWLGILAFDRSRWNTLVPSAPWAGQQLLADASVWDGIPSQRPAPPSATQPPPTPPAPPAPPEG